jgi:hypothetical protein
MTMQSNPFNLETHGRSHELWKVCSELRTDSASGKERFVALKGYCDANKAMPETEGFVKEMQNPQAGILRSLGDRVEKLTSRGPTLFQTVAYQYDSLRKCVLSNEEQVSLREKWVGDNRDFVLGVHEGSQEGEQSIQENAALTRRIAELEGKQYPEEDEEGFYASHRRARPPPNPVAQNSITKEQALVRLWGTVNSEGVARKTAYLSFIGEDALILKAMLSKKEITVEDAERYHSTYSKVLEGVKSDGSTSVSQNVQALKDEIDRAKTPSWFSSRVEVLAVEEAAATKHETMAYMVSKVVAVVAAVTVTFGAGLFWGGRFSK